MDNLIQKYKRKIFIDKKQIYQHIEEINCIDFIINNIVEAREIERKILDNIINIESKVLTS